MDAIDYGIGTDYLQLFEDTAIPAGIMKNMLTAMKEDYGVQEAAFLSAVRQEESGRILLEAFKSGVPLPELQAAYRDGMFPIELREKILPLMQGREAIPEKIGEKMEFITERPVHRLFRPPYGYIKDPRDKHQLIVDPEAAEIVKKIYEMCLQGTTKHAIVLYLNEHGIPSPTAYRMEKGLPYSPAVADNPMWGNKIVNDILKNPIYTGDLVQGRRRVKSYKVHQIEAVPEEEWVRVPNTHEAIITHETFDRVQALLLRDTRTAPKGRELHLFSGFLKCADCGKSVTRSQSGKNIYYACSTYKNRSRTACTMHSIKHNRLEAAVLFAIQYQVGTAVSYSEMIAHINTAPLKKSQSHRLNDQIAAK